MIEAQIDCLFSPLSTEYPNSREDMDLGIILSENKNNLDIFAESVLWIGIYSIFRFSRKENTIILNPISPNIKK